MLVPAGAPAGTLTWKRAVTVWPGSTAPGTGPAGVTVQPWGALRVNRACGIAKSPSLTTVVLTVAVEPGSMTSGAWTVAYRAPRVRMTVKLPRAGRLARLEESPT